MNQKRIRSPTVLKRLILVFDCLLPLCPERQRVLPSWSIFDWEYKVAVSTSASPEGVALLIRTYLNTFGLPEEEALLAGSVSDASTHSRRSQAYCCSFAAQSRGNVVLLNFSLGVFCSADGTLISGAFDPQPIKSSCTIYFVLSVIMPVNSLADEQEWHVAEPLLQVLDASAAK